MLVAGAQKKIVDAIALWEGVSAEPHRFGGTEFRLGRRELGHVHGDSLADIAFPMKVRERLIAEGRVEPHHILPNSGWITFRFRKEADVGCGNRAVQIILRACSWEASHRQLSLHLDGPRFNLTAPLSFHNPQHSGTYIEHRPGCEACISLSSANDVFHTPLDSTVPLLKIR